MPKDTSARKATRLKPAAHLPAVSSLATPTSFRTCTSTATRADTPARDAKPATILRMISRTLPNSGIVHSPFRVKQITLDNPITRSDRRAFTTWSTCCDMAAHERPFNCWKLLYYFGGFVHPFREFVTGL